MLAPVEERLHKRAGVRQPDLARFLTEPFADRLHVFDDDTPDAVLAKVIWQVSAVIKQVTHDPKWVTVLDAMYNLSQDPELNPLILTGRLEVLKRRHGAGWDPSTTNTALSELRRTHIFPGLKGVFPWPPEHEIEELARSEAEYRAKCASQQETVEPPEDTTGLLIADTIGGRRRLLAGRLPQTFLHFAVSAQGNLVTTQTVEFGEILPAFTTESLLSQYLAAVRAPESDVRTVAAGRAVINVLVDRGRVGLAVNLLGGYEADRGQHWTAEELLEL